MADEGGGWGGWSLGSLTQGLTAVANSARALTSDAVASASGLLGALDTPLPPEESGGGDVTGAVAGAPPAAAARGARAGAGRESDVTSSDDDVPRAEGEAWAAVDAPGGGGGAVSPAAGAPFGGGAVRRLDMGHDESRGAAPWAGPGAASPRERAALTSVADDAIAWPPGTDARATELLRMKARARDVFDAAQQAVPWVAHADGARA